MEKRKTTDQFRSAISRLKSDLPKTQKGVYYTTQKQHWLCFLNEYDTNQTYGRLQGMNRDAKFVYNHIVCPEMLVYLIKAVGIDPNLVKQVEEASVSGITMMASVGKIRQIVPWPMIYDAMWSEEDKHHIYPRKINLRRN